MILPPRPDDMTVGEYTFWLDGFQYQFQIAVVGASWKKKGQRQAVFPTGSPEYVGYNVMQIRGTLLKFLRQYKYLGVKFNVGNENQ